MPKEKDICLHLGCGGTIIKEKNRIWINIDVQKFSGVDRIMRIFPLKFKANFATLIYASHCLDHIEEGKLKVLKDWVKILKPGGVLRLSVPDFEKMVELYQKEKDIDLIKGCVCGRGDKRVHCHSILFDYKKLKNLMEEAGLEAVHRWSPRHQTHRNFFDMSQAMTCNIPISLNLEGFKAIRK